MDASKREYRERLDLKRAEERVIIEVWWESRRVRYLGKYTRPSCVPTKRKWFTSDADVFFPLWRLVSGASFPKFWMRLTGPCVFLKWSMYRFVLGTLGFFTFNQAAKEEENYDEMRVLRHLPWSQWKLSNFSMNMRSFHFYWNIKC